jgi:hypothetical protein
MTLCTELSLQIAALTFVLASYAQRSTPHFLSISFYGSIMTTIVMSIQTLIRITIGAIL